MAEQPRIEYHLTVTDAAHHLAEVQITWPEVTTRALEVQLPVWRSGRYEILDLSKNISRFSAQHPDGEPIAWERMDKNTWKLLLNRAGAVQVRYTVYANMLSHRVAHIDPTHAFVDASGVFMFAPAQRDRALQIELSVPDGWRSRSGMPSSAAHRFVADNYDQLVDSPIESGEHLYTEFSVDGHDYGLLIWGAGNHDIDDLQQQLAKLHPVAGELWGDFPFQRYLYMYHVGDGLRGATEHVNSTIIQRNRDEFRPRKDYLKVLSTSAHEFIHTWNVKAYRPAGIAPYDYSGENYSDLFWMAEGITSYYDELFLLRAGIYTAKEFYARLADTIHDHLNKPGRTVESLAQTSFNTWLSRDRQQLHNDSVSIYLEGSLVAWALDREIRVATDNARSLDDLQRLLYQRHRNTDRGYRKADVLALLQEITGQSMADFWAAHVEGTAAIDFDALLAHYGLERVFDTDEDESAASAWIGAKLDSGDGRVLIQAVDRDGPAWRAGLNVGDEWLAIDGIQLLADAASDRVAELPLDRAVEIHYFSAGRLQSSQLQAISDPQPEFKIQPLDKPSKAQKRAHQSWSGHQIDPD